MKTFLAIGFIIVVFAGQLTGQNNAKKIRESRDKTLREIEYANKLLIETQGKTKESLNEVNLINHKLSKRKEYLIGIEVEMSVLDQAIEGNQLTINNVEKEIEKLKLLYARMIVNGYKNQSRKFGIMYFLASENLNQLYRRIRTIKLFNSYLKKKHSELSELRMDYLRRNDELQKLKNEKDVLVKKAKRETLTIQQEVNQKNNLVKQLKKKQKEIEAEIKNKEGTAKKLENELRRIIAEEKKKIKSSGSKERMTPAEKIISGDFEKNAGRLPWPTQKGVITGQYGEHQHPDYKSVTVRNDGIYIATSTGEYARSIFKGVVSRVFSIPGENYTVIIKHGQFYSLYHNLIHVSVKAGQSVEIKENIGKVFTNDKTKETILYFQIWKETERRDPELWLAPL
ncbi:MAG: peptidoglycan DD-metalloendopeptidase family protein [Bacteroidales bacterium]|nr:peptidoglycan DD-metalloendopeptidase family protein [Bacteroidales bacterium]